MKEKKLSLRRSECPINVLLEMLGDTWSLLIVRDMIFLGSTTYNEFLNASEGIATNILSDRLQRLECVGIVEKRRNPSDARKFIYRLTAKGLDLAPMLVEMILWSAQYEETAAPPEILELMKADKERFIAGLKQNWAKNEQL